MVNFVHHEVIESFISLETFATLVYARFDMRQGRMIYVDCGHTPVMHRSARSGAVRRIKGNNLPLGFLATEVYEEESEPFEPSDTFFFYSDGVTEARTPQGKNGGRTGGGGLDARIRDRPCCAGHHVLPAHGGPGLHAAAGRSHLRDGAGAAFPRDGDRAPLIVV